MSTTLRYVIVNPRQQINLNLFEAEKYEPAVIVQQLLGTLVYFSNFGRNEPRLAESWSRPDDYTWSFKLKKNLRCENGEEITAASYKKSLERTLHIFERKGGVPILSSLSGYDVFVKKNKDVSDIDLLSSLDGIQANGDLLNLKFNKKIKNGVLQILSFSPFGYLCRDNFTASGDWKSDSTLVSSGPYKATEVKLGERYVLEKNPHWNEFLEGSPDKVIFSHDESEISTDEAVIVDAFTNDYKSEKFKPYKLVPEYLNSVLLGNLKDGIFRDHNARLLFKKTFDEVLEEILPVQFGANTRSNTFYANQSIKTELPKSNLKTINPPSNKLLIEGTVPAEGSSRWHAWRVLKATLEKMNLPFQFVNTESSFKEMTNQKYDIRIRGASIGGGVEAWGLYVAFCSSMGISFPDPSGKVCEAILQQEDDKISDQEFSNVFLSAVASDAAILPVSHFGVQLFTSNKVNTETLSPLLSIMKFDQIQVKN